MPRKKLYIAVKCGLIEDAKHREAIGNRIWLYLHILNRCEWEAGKVLEWRDRDEAQELNMSQRTLATQRQELADLGYISCQQKGNHQVITVHNWTNPRSYGGEIINKGTQKCAPSKAKGTPEGTPEGTYEGSNEMSTPTYNQIPNDRYQNGDGEKPGDGGASDFSSLVKVYENNINLITPIMADELRDALKEYPLEWIETAIKETVKSGVRNWNYALAILKRWKSGGKISLGGKKSTGRNLPDIDTMSGGFYA